VIYQSKRGKVLEVNPGQRFFDWTPPEEMEIEEAFVRGQDWRVVERRRRT
jgi:aminopeptidase-like protein